MWITLTCYGRFAELQSRNHIDSTVTRCIIPLFLIKDHSLVFRKALIASNIGRAAKVGTPMNTKDSIIIAVYIRLFIEYIHLMIYIHTSHKCEDHHFVVLVGYLRSEVRVELSIH